MWQVRCPYCPGTQGLCAVTAAGRLVTECCSCGRVVEERQVQAHQLFLLRAHDNPLCLVTPDLSSLPHHHQQPVLDPIDKEEDEDPFEPTGFITAFSTWSLSPAPLFARSASSFAGHLAELERALLDSSSAASTSSSVDSSGPLVSVDHLRAYLQIMDVSSILGLYHDIADHAFELFRDCSSTTCLRNRSVEALATAALVQAIREAQEPRTLQEISAAANLPQKEIGKYIKILGEALKLSQPINSNSISVHMPRFCTLLQLNKSAQELAAHIGEVVINKCFCTRRNPISISAAAIYLACQLEDKRKTQAEICKVTGLTEVTLRKVYKELLENWDDLLPPNYTPAVPPEKAFPMTAISARSTPKIETTELSPFATHHEKDKHMEIIKPSKFPEVSGHDHQDRGKGLDNKDNSHGPPIDPRLLNKAAFWQPKAPFGMPESKANVGKEKGDRDISANETKSTTPSLNSERKCDGSTKNNNIFQRLAEVSGPQSSNEFSSNLWPFHVRPVVPGQAYVRSGQQEKGSDFASGLQGFGSQKKGEQADDRCNTDSR